MDWFLYDNGLRHERVKTQQNKSAEKKLTIQYRRVFYMEILNWLEDEGTTTANYLAFLLCYMLRKRNEWKVKKEIHILRL